LLNQPSGKNTNKANDLKDYKDFINDLREKDKLFYKLLPSPFPLREVLGNIREELLFDVKEKDKAEEFDKFRNRLHKTLWVADEKLADNFGKKYQNSQILPGRLPNIRLADKKETNITSIIGRMAGSMGSNKYGASKVKDKDSMSKTETESVKMDKMKENQNLKTGKLNGNQREDDDKGLPGTFQEKSSLEKHQKRLKDMEDKKDNGFPKVHLTAFRKRL